MFKTKKKSIQELQRDWLRTPKKYYFLHRIPDGVHTTTITEKWFLAAWNSFCDRFTEDSVISILVER